MLILMSNGVFSQQLKIAYEPDVVMEPVVESLLLVVDVMMVLVHIVPLTAMAAV